MRHLGARRVAVAVGAALAFGVGMSVLKGNGSGVRDAIGNLSAPWLILPFIAGAWAGGGRVGRAAAVGVAASFAALAGFYFTNSFVLALGPHPWLVDLRLAFGGGYFFKLGAISGPVFGALGGLWQRRGLTALGVMVAALLIFEPVAWLLKEHAEHSLYTSDAAVWACEVAAGVAAATLAATVARPGRRARS